MGKHSVFHKLKPKNAKPSIKAFFSDEEMSRIEQGPLRATAGRGKGAWLRGLALKAIEEAECRIRN
jgi:hypothetical protein